MTFVHPKKPCAECPWRRDVAPGHFPPERYRALARTAYDQSMILFACHKSIEGKETACAGFLLRGAEHNLSVRLSIGFRRYKPDEVSDGGYDLFDDYRQMAIANGVKASDPVLRACRHAHQAGKLNG